MSVPQRRRRARPAITTSVIVICCRLAMTTSFTFLGRMASRGHASCHRIPVPSPSSVGNRFGGAFLRYSSTAAAQSSPNESADYDDDDDGGPRAPYGSRVLDGVEHTLSRVLSHPKIRESGANPPSSSEREDLSYLHPASLREAVGVARYVRRRLDALEKNGDCRRCWLQEVHCVCGACPPLEQDAPAGVGAGRSDGDGGDDGSRRSAPPPGVRRLFLLTHHKEVGMVVDTAKLILAAFPHSSRLVISGIGEAYQHSMEEMKEAFERSTKEGRCMVLFPSEDARTFEDIAAASNAHGSAKGTNLCSDDIWDIIIIDGTWAQARKMYNKYIPAQENGGPIRVRLSDDAVRTLGGGSVEVDVSSTDNSLAEVHVPGHQLRRHPIKWREVSTFEATRLLLKDMAEYYREGVGHENTWDKLAEYQRVADKAARTQLGPKRMKQKV